MSFLPASDGLTGLAQGPEKSLPEPVHDDQASRVFQINFLPPSYLPAFENSQKILLKTICEFNYWWKTFSGLGVDSVRNGRLAE